MCQQRSAALSERVRERSARWRGVCSAASRACQARTACRAARRAHILAKKVSPRAFVEQPGKKGQATGEVGIEGTTIEAPDAVRATAHGSARP